MSDLGNKEIMARNIKKYMKLNDLTVRQLSDKLGTPYTTVNDWVKGNTYPRIDKIEKMANLWGIEKADLVEKETRESNISRFAEALRLVRLFDPISCGQGLMVDENAVGCIGVPLEAINVHCSYFGNRAEGDSMEPKIHNGDYVVFEEMPEVASGQIGAFSLNGEYYCKRFKRMPDGSCWLFSENADYEPIRISPEDEFRTLGKFKFRLTSD